MSPALISIHEQITASTQQDHGGLLHVLQHIDSLTDNATGLERQETVDAIKSIVALLVRNGHMESLSIFVKLPKDKDLQEAVDKAMMFQLIQEKDIIAGYVDNVTEQDSVRAAIDIYLDKIDSFTTKEIFESLVLVPDLIGHENFLPLFSKLAERAKEDDFFNQFVMDLYAAMNNSSKDLLKEEHIDQQLAILGECLTLNDEHDVLLRNGKRYYIPMYACSTLFKSSEYVNIQGSGVETFLSQAIAEHDVDIFRGPISITDMFFKNMPDMVARLENASMQKTVDKYAPEEVVKTESDMDDAANKLLDQFML